MLKKIIIALACIASSHSVASQQTFAKGGIDTVLFGMKLDLMVVSARSVTDLPDLAFGLFHLNGEIIIPENLLVGSPVQSLFCDRVGGHIVTYYYVLLSKDDTLTKKLSLRFGLPQQAFQSFTPNRHMKHQEDNLVWKLSGQSVYYLPAILSSFRLLILHNSSEPTFLKRYGRLLND